MAKIVPVVYSLGGEANAAGVFEAWAHHWLWTEYLYVNRIVVQGPVRATMYMRFGMQLAAQVAWLGYVALFASGFPTPSTIQVYVPAGYRMYFYGSGFTAADKILAWIYGYLTPPET
jgi:hypothetical protein